MNRFKRAPVEPAGADSYRHRAESLIRNNRTMVLATSADGVPWAAPVYFVYSPPGFYFFSSRRARHIEQGLPADNVSAAIFADSDQWEQIQGIQMSGALDAVTRKTEQLKVVARFLSKFPFARPFLQAGPDRGGDAPPFVGGRVGLYVFVPHEVYYLNNELGFGQRVPVDLNP